MSYNEVLDQCKRLEPYIEHMNDTYGVKLDLTTRLARHPLISDELRTFLVSEMKSEADWCEANLVIVKKTEMVERTWYEVEEIS